MLEEKLALSRQDLVSCPTVASRRRMGVAKKTPKMRTRIGRQPPQERAR